jgi:hypothetical protein
MAEREGDPVHLHGVRIGDVRLTGERHGHEVVIKATLKLDWPGLWHAAARSLDKDQER